MTGIRVLVADDEPLARRMVATLLEDDVEVESVVECGDAKSVREAIARHRPDIVFLDVEMPEPTGLEIAAGMSEDAPVIVFITAFSRYAPQAFDVSAADYVLKPFSDHRFGEALQRAKRRMRHNRLDELASQVATLSAELRPEEAEPWKATEHGYLKRLAFKHEGRAIVRGWDSMWPEPGQTPGSHCLRFEVDGGVDPGPVIDEADGDDVRVAFHIHGGQSPHACAPEFRPYGVRRGSMRAQRVQPRVMAAKGSSRRGRTMIPARNASLTLVHRGAL